MTEQEHGEGKNTKERRKSWIAVMILIIVILSFAFYWFEIKPLTLRRDCMKWMLPMVSEIEDTETFDFIYNICIDVGGNHQVKEALKKELTD